MKESRKNSYKKSLKVTQSYGVTSNKPKSALIIKKVDALVLRSFTTITPNFERLIQIRNYFNNFSTNIYLFKWQVLKGNIHDFFIILFLQDFKMQL